MLTSMSFSTLNATRRKNEEVRRNARMWREVDDFADQPSPRKFTHTRRPLKAAQPAPDGRWDEEGRLLDSAKDTNSITHSKPLATPKPRRRSASVCRESREETLRRLSSVRKPKREKKEKKIFESDFEGFMKRQTESGKIRREAEKKYSISRKPMMSQGSKAILRRSKRNQEELSEPSSARRERKMTPEKPARTVRDTSRRLMTMDVKDDVSRVQAKKEVLRHEIMEDTRDIFTYRPECNKPIPASSRVKDRDGRPKISTERKMIERKRIEVQPIIEEAEADHWVKPRYGRVPDYIREIADICPADRRDDQRRASRERSDRKRIGH